MFYWCNLLVQVVSMVTVRSVYISHNIIMWKDFKIKINKYLKQKQKRNRKKWILGRPKRGTANTMRQCTCARWSLNKPDCFPVYSLLVSAKRYTDVELSPSVVSLILWGNRARDARGEGGRNSHTSDFREDIISLFKGALLPVPSGPYQ